MMMIGKWKRMCESVKSQEYELRSRTGDAEPRFRLLAPALATPRYILGKVTPT